MCELEFSIISHIQLMLFHTSDNNAISDLFANTYQPRPFRRSLSRLSFLTSVSKSTGENAVSPLFYRDSALYSPSMCSGGSDRDSSPPFSSSCSPVTPPTPLEVYATKDTAIEPNGKKVARLLDDSHTVSHNSVGIDNSDTPVSYTISPRSPASPRRVTSSVEEIERKLRDFAGADPMFTIEMDNVLAKSVQALNDPPSAYLFRDFAGHYTTFLDRFGPGGFDSHRAPPSMSWMFKLLEPWLEIVDSAGHSQPLRTTLIANFAEVNGWIQNIARVLGDRCKPAIFGQDLWYICCEQMAHPDPEIHSIAHSTTRTFVQSLSLDSDTVNWVLAMRNAVVDYDTPHQAHFRRFHLSLLNELVHKIALIGHPSNCMALLTHLQDILTLLAQLERGGDPLVIRSIEYAQYVQNRLIDASDSSPIVGPHVSMDSTCSAEPKTLSEPAKPSRWHRFTQKLSRVFKHEDSESATMEHDMLDYLACRETTTNT